MKIVIGSDHAGYSLKSSICRFLREQGQDVLDVGTSSTEPVDYPDYALKVARQVANDATTRGILICGSGIGASVAANKVKGVRAGVCHDTYSGHQGVEHDDMNVLVLGARIIGIEPAKEIVFAYVAAKFTGEERHLRRLNKVKQIEESFGKNG